MYNSPSNSTIFKLTLHPYHITNKEITYNWRVVINPKAKAGFWALPYFCFKWQLVKERIFFHASVANNRTPHQLHKFHNLPEIPLNPSPH